MAKAAYKVPEKNYNMMMTITFGIMFVVNFAVLWLANIWFPSMVVLGTMSLTALWSLVLTAGALALIDTLLMPLFTEIEIRRNRILAPQEWLIGYLVVNAAALWLITRASDVFGMGVSSWIVVLVLAAATDFAQGMAMMAWGEMQKK